jgi:hypothetical protein
MYDFWFTLGTAAIYPDLVTNQIAPAAFTFVDRLVVEVSGAQLAVRSGPSTGLLDRTATTTVRGNISAYLRGKWGNAAPPVGIYTAGRFCQLVKIPQFSSTIAGSAFKDIIASANKAYTTAVGGGAATTTPAILGLCLMDAQVASLIANYDNLQQPQKDQATEILGEFGITAGSARDRNWVIAKAFVYQNNDFNAAVTNLMGATGDLNPWAQQGNTLEQVIFWPNDGTLKGEHAVP